MLSSDLFLSKGRVLNNLGLKLLRSNNEVLVCKKFLNLNIDPFAKMWILILFNGSKILLKYNSYLKIILNQ